MDKTWYEHTLENSFKSNFQLKSNSNYDVVIVGGGLAGLSLLLQLVESGLDALLIESEVIGAGASGRNGGFCSPGWSQDYDALSNYLDLETVKELDRIASLGVMWMRKKCHEKGYENTYLTEGIITCFLGGKEREVEQKVKNSNKIFGSKNSFLTKNDLRDIITSDRYLFGIKKDNAFHFHPLNFMKSLASECTAKGAKISEKSRLISFDKNSNHFNLKISIGKEIKTIRSNKVVFATGGYAGSEIKALRKYWIPIKTFIGVTEPLGKRIQNLFKRNFGFSDNRRAGNYFRIVGGDRISWGRGISAFGDISESLIKKQVSDDINFFFPQLGGINIDYAWSGKMAYASHMMPYVGPIQAGKEEGLFALTGFGGHGMNTAPGAAIILADHLISGGNSCDVFNAFKRTWNGGFLGPYAAEIKYTYLRLRDYLEQVYQRH